MAVHSEEAAELCRGFLHETGYVLETVPDLDVHSLVAVDRNQARRTASTCLIQSTSRTFFFEGGW